MPACVIVSGGGGGGGAWEDAVAAMTMSGQSSGWNGYTVVMKYAAAGLTGSASSQARVTVQGPTAANLTVSSLYIGHKASSGDAYDFDGSQAQVLFSGSGSVALISGAVAVSDAVAFSYDPAVDLLLSFYIPASPGALLQRSGVLANVQSYYAFGDSAATTNKSGFSANDTRSHLISRVEVS